MSQYTNNHPLRLAILISGNGSNLQAIIDAIAAGLPAKISVVISNQEQAFGLVRAARAGIPVKILSHKAFPDRTSYDAALQSCLDEYQPELIILAGFMRILSDEFVRHFHPRLLNIHPSLLPKYPGLNTHQQALANGDSTHGVTVHIVTPEVDAGPIIAQAATRITLEDTTDSLKAKVQQLEHQIYPEVIRLYAEGRLQLHDNGVSLDGQLLPVQGGQFSFSPLADQNAE
ncbi:MAG TPA: phosphoribosylglycinamide formyltransferase [Gammaproteobacteria bacterium]|nr:phosphoribosylglycinamide formyltransferase [Gammaproteobacteria bacterium]